MLVNLYIPEHKLNKGLLFIHIPRTGGVSVEIALLDMPSQGRHKTYSYWEEEQDIEQFYRFTIIRNTFSRLLSFYRYHSVAWWIKDKNEIYGKPTASGFREWCARGFPCHVQGELDECNFNGTDFLKIAPFLESRDGGPGKLDSILRTERLDTDFSSMMAKIGVPLELPFVNKSPNKFGMEAYDATTKKHVIREFGDELETYQFQCPQ